MLTAEELANIRKGGANDADILNEYKQYDPQSASDIDNLVKGGANPKDVLDTLIEFHKGSQDASGGKPTESDRPWYSKLGRALQYGASNAIGGLGSTARRGGYTGVADTLKQAAEATEPKDYETHGDKFHALSPSTYGELPYAAAEGAPGMLADIAAGIAGSTLGPAGSVGGFMASNAARNLGPNLDARVGGADKPATSKDMAIAGASTLAEGALNRLGLGPAVGSVAKGVGKEALKSAAGQVAKSAATEGAAGVAGDVVNQVGRTAGTEGGLSINPEEALNSGAMSGALGGAARFARVPGDVNNAVKNRDVNTNAASRLVDRMDGLQVKTNTPEEAYKAVQTTRTSLDSNINEASKTVNPFLKSKGNDTDLDQTRALLNETKSLLKSNKVVPQEQLDDLGNRLGHLEEGQALHSLLEERQELNRLADQGRFEKSGDQPNGYFAGGIMSNQIAQNMLDPLTALKSRMAPAIAAGGGIAGLTAGAKLAAVAPYAGYALAGQLGLQGAASGIDRMLGNRNPAREFMDRMRGLDQGEGPTAPSARQAQEAAKAQAALAKLQGQLDGSERAADVQATREDARKTSQTDKAWKEKAKQDAAQEAQDARRQEEVDRAYQQANGRPGPSEDALWASYEKDQAARSKDDVPDLEAQAGIQQGYKFLAEQAMRAQQAREAQTDKAYAEKGKQDAVTAKQQAEMDKAWASRDGKPGPTEDDLWAAHEKAAGSEPSDLEAQAGIQQGYKFLAEQALKAQALRESQTTKAEKERDRQDAQEAQATKGRNRDFSKAEAERNRPDPDRVKAAQEEAMWRAQEDGTLPQDWSDADAISAIKREENGRAKESNDVVKNAAKKALLAKQAAEKAATPKKAEASVADVGDTLDFPGDTPALKIKVKPKAKAEPEPEAPKSADSNPETVKVKVGDQTVERPTEGIRNVNAYVTKTRSRMETRATFAKSILDEAGPRQKQHLDTMLGKLNNTAKSWDQALDIIHDAITDLPFNQQSHAWDMYNLHEGHLRATYDN